MAVMRKLALVVVAMALGVTGLASVAASPIPPAPELWFIDSDGSDARPVIQENYGWSGFTWSPDSREFAYLLSSELHVRDVATGVDRVLVSPVDPAGIEWSPDGKWILYKFSAPDGVSGFRAVSPTDGTIRTIYQQQGAILSGATWAPDSTRIAFAGALPPPRPSPGNPASLFVVDGSSGTATEIVSDQSNYVAPTWAPDGSWIAFTTWDSNVAIVRPDGSDLKVVTIRGEYGASPDWSPDGSRLAIGTAGGLYVVDPDTNTRMRIADQGFGPEWSPDGNEIVYSADGDLFVVDVDTGGSRQLTEDPRRNDAPRAWSPDGNTIAFSSIRQLILCPGFPFPVEASIVGTSGDNHLVGTDGADVIAGLGGNDTIEGFGGNDIVCGGAGEDAIFGNDGSDTLHGQGGRDVLEGASGNDTFDGGPSSDKLEGNGGSDIVVFLSSNRGVTIDLAQGTSRGNGADVLTSIENASGTTGRDTLRGDRRKNVLRGSSVDYYGDRNDRLIGRAGSDELYGDEGDDVLRAGAGNDYLEGDRYRQRGSDELYGGRGTDTCRRGAIYVSCEHHPPL